ncbi:hypothetical protein [Caldimonas tepidiphila]|uniref:hypothetical protein n=1 Tax=Caldimonas tepidiphila TaxID=2315841 RepID=UPI000E5C2F99|nr:hypothetical protein [Caldimonas tepidiphila]
MGIRYLKEHAALEGQVTVEDAEALMQYLREAEKPTVHLGRCEHLHAAVLQVLLALAPRIDALPADPWLAAVLGAAGEEQPCPA